MPMKERDEDDLDDLVIKETDSLILVAKTEDDVSHLEVHVYEEDTDNLYVHHDVMLPAFPLCIEWLGFSNQEGKRGPYLLCFALLNQRDSTRICLFFSFFCHRKPCGRWNFSARD